MRQQKKSVDQGVRDNTLVRKSGGGKILVIGKCSTGWKFGIRERESSFVCVYQRVERTCVGQRGEKMKEEFNNVAVMKEKKKIEKKGRVTEKETRIVLQTADFRRN